MPRKTRRSMLPPPPRTRTPWSGYLLTALGAAALGTGLTYAALRPALNASRASSPAPPQLGAGGKPSPTTSGAGARAAGNAAFDRKDWATAAADYTQAIAAGLDNPDIRTDLGTSYRNLHQPQQALTQFATAQREDSRHENSLLNQGIVYAFDLHDTAQAASVWHLYLQRFPHGQHAADVRHFLSVIQPAAPPRS